MTSIDLRPSKLDIFAYAGDTITLHVRTDVNYSGATWAGSIKDSDAIGEPIAASFTFSSTTLDSQTGTWLTTVKLEEALTASLLNSANVGNTGNAPVPYTGVWDIQVTYDDPIDTGSLKDVITLLRGTITIEGDITDT